MQTYVVCIQSKYMYGLIIKLLRYVILKNFIVLSPKFSLKFKFKTFNYMLDIIDYNFRLNLRYLIIRKKK